MTIGYVVAVKGATSAYTSDAAPQQPRYAGRWTPPDPRYRDPHQCLQGPGRGRRPRRPENGDLATRRPRPTPTTRPRRCAPDSSPCVSARQTATSPAADDGQPPQAWLLAEWPTGAEEPTDYVDLHPRPGHTSRNSCAWPKSAARIEHDYRRTENRTRTRSLRGTLLDRLAPPRHPRHRRPPIPHHPAANRPKSHGQDSTLYGLVRKLQRALAHWIGTCPLCHHTFPT